MGDFLVDGTFVGSQNGFGAEFLLTARMVTDNSLGGGDLFWRKLKFSFPFEMLLLFFRLERFIFHFTLICDNIQFCNIFTRL